MENDHDIDQLKQKWFDKYIVEYRRIFLSFDFLFQREDLSKYCTFIIFLCIKMSDGEYSEFITARELVEACEKYEKNNSIPSNESDEIFDQDISTEMLLTAVTEAERKFFAKNKPEEHLFDTSISTQDLLEATIAGEKRLHETILNQLLSTDGATE